MSDTAQRPGILWETPDVSIFDTRELAWVPAPDVAPGARRKWLGGKEGEPQASLLFLPPDFPTGREPAPAASSTVDEFWFTLAGERSTWEFDGPDGQQGALVRHRPGVAMHRRPGALYAVDAEFRSATGWTGIVVRDGGADASAGAPVPAFDRLAPTGGVPAEAAPGSGVILDRTHVTAIDSLRADWQPAAYSDLPPVVNKVLGRYPSGGTKLQILHFPPGLSPDRRPDDFPFYPPALRAARHYHHRMLELLYVLDGEMPVAEWESIEQQDGEFVWWREGIFAFRREGSLHGSLPGETSATGVSILHFRLGGSESPAEPAFPEQVVVDVPFHA